MLSTSCWGRPDVSANVAYFDVDVQGPGSTIIVFILYHSLFHAVELLFLMQANALVAEAEKKLSGGKGFLSGLFGWVASHPWNNQL